MKSILMSIHPEWSKKIFDGEKTIEVRKTRPLIDMPFKVYVYCTKQKLTKTKCMHSYLHKNEPKACKKYGEITTWCSIGDVHVNSNTPWSFRSYGMHGKVIGSFVCNKIISTCGWRIKGHTGRCVKRTKSEEDFPKNTCLSIEGIVEYSGDENREIYGWHITEPKLFDKPRELREFCVPCKEYDSDKPHCGECDYYKYSPNDSGDAQEDCLCDGYKPLRRPPMSWCYVEGE